MRSGQATGLFVSIPLLLFIGVCIVFKIHLHWLVWVVLVALLFETLSLTFHGNEEDDEDAPLYPEKDRLEGEIPGASVTQINGHTIRVDTKKRSVVIGKERDDTPYFQRTDKKREPTGKKIYSESGDNLSKHIRREMNK